MAKMFNDSIKATNTDKVVPGIYIFCGLNGLENCYAYKYDEL